MSHQSRNPIHPLHVLAYRCAVYSVQIPPGEFDLRINQVSKELQAIMKHHQADTAAYLTAFNPYSSTVTTEQNIDAQCALEAELKELGLSTYGGAGKDPSGHWPAEKSVLVLGIPLAEADRMATRYRQNGFVWCGSSVALCTLRLMGPLLIPSAEELAAWRGELTDDERDPVSNLNAKEQAILMTVTDTERRHWIFPDGWDLNQAWPEVRPDGSTMGIGTELDRQFKLIAAGLVPVVTEYVLAES